MRRILCLALFGFLTAGCRCCLAGDADATATPVSLAGTWRFRLDAEAAGVERRWFATDLPDRTKLPGSTDENHYGTRNTRKPDFSHLARLYEYTGPAWYQRDIDIPVAWKGKRVTLFLERCHWETRVWLDDRPCGMQDSLCVPHIHDLTAAISPGKHRLTIRVDNTFKVNVGNWAHSVTEETQTNWNGIVGRIELRATDPVWIDDVQVYPNIATRSAKVRATVGNVTGRPMPVVLGLSVQSAVSGQGRVPARAVVPAGGTVIEAEVPMGLAPALWGEFAPNLYTLRTAVVVRTAGIPYNDIRLVTFGMRDFNNGGGKQLTLNGRRVFVRATLECCIFPLTGYPPTTVEPWLRILRIAKSYGLNSLRFHSWCPPEAAFIAADRMGFIYHVEAPQWVGDVGKDPARDTFIEEELKRILDTYGNHPSFGMMCMGNELTGDPGFLQKLVKLGQQRDRRHLYTPSTAWSQGDADDYRVAVIRGLHGPGTDADFRDADAQQKVPVISHEIGQWTLFPNLAEIPKYTGVTRARNFEIVRDDLTAKHMLGQSPAFVQATGRFSALLYKEEMEVLFRTPGHGGFQLLDLHDFPGQGTSIVGILDAFWDSKGVIKPEEWRRFCGPTVPLLQMKKRTFTADEPFVAEAEVSHFGPTDLKAATPAWTITDAAGREVAAGSLPALNIPTGSLTSLGKIEARLSSAQVPSKLKVTVAIEGTPFANDWDIWVYPSQVDVAAPAGVTVATAWDTNATSALSAGKKVVLLASPGIIAKAVQGSFTPVFWGPVMFANQPGTMSILCDPKHPALAQFPTDGYTNWQWYDLLQGSRSVILDDAPPEYRPTVQMIDNFSRNHRLGDIFEAKVGPGRLLVCSLNLKRNLDTSPAARQMLHSLLAYAASDAFQPAQELTPAYLATLFRERSPLDAITRAPALDEKPLLRVKAAVKVPQPNTPAPWAPEADEVLAREPGFDYSVQGSTWRDETGAAWHDGSDLRVTVTCPKGFTGTLYAHFHDWNHLQRVAEVFFQGRSFGELENYDGPGVWLAFPVTAEDSKDGKLEISSRPMHANTMITQIVLKSRPR
jgi:hypothetical protein